MSFFGKFKTSSTPDASKTANSTPAKKDPNAPVPTPLEKHLADLSGQPIRLDGSDKYFGFENYGSTCYCNSIVQCLYYSKPFRENVISFPAPDLLEHIRSKQNGAPISPRSTSTTPYPNPTSPARKVLVPGSPGPGGVKPDEDKNSPDNRKKKALADGPVLDMQAERAIDYGMEESLFTSLRDIFEAIIKNPSRIGVVSPHRFLEILRRDNEMFRSAMHQDAHEFLNLLLNQVMDNVELFAKQHPQIPATPLANGNAHDSKELALTKTHSTTAPMKTLDTHWVHDLFEGTLTSETRCLTCENTSQRDEAFLDLSVDLDSHSSVTSCLRKFSEEEMLCERNKFHCDNCGGLQEAEKRMKIKRLPRILALHLKRFKYTEDLQRLQKLFHRVVYPFYLRLFNTTDEAEDPDRLYELYSVVVHIGGGPYHGHYVSIVKTEDRGWLLFDDELVEPVSKDYVQQFFGGEPVPGVQDAKQLACAYVLFYQETTMEKMLKEQEMEGQPAPAAAAARASDVGESRDSFTSPTKTMNANGLFHASTNIQTPIAEEPAYAQMEPIRRASTTPNFEHALLNDPPPAPVMPTKSKKELKAEEKERKVAEKAAIKEKEAAYREASRKRMEAYKQTEENMKRALEESKATAAAEADARGTENGSGDGHTANGTTTAEDTGEKRKSGFSRFSRGSISLRKKPSIFEKKEKRNSGDKTPMPAIPQKEGFANGGSSSSHDEHDFAAASHGDHKTHHVITSASQVQSPPPMHHVVAEEKTHKKNRFSLGRKKSSLLP
ncbi:Putative ubiquitin specific protease, papain-like cysteine peptidase superfamily [Septoria linicola]|uniref:Ubiquitin carboxyl-terminal hydrolase n=1 Tax=Septoria linicola TaxID=215465 RepID=A0A9Q9B201_9PEZI|nr:Putative ubiquitin specific protease, papain-like cysteine peptidase superfamily [Septoria linicola]